MTTEAVLTRMLDIYISNVIIGLGWATAALIFLKVAKKDLRSPGDPLGIGPFHDYNDRKEREREQK